MRTATPPSKAKTALALMASIGLICAFVFGIQPALDFILGGGTIFVSRAGAEVQDLTGQEAPSAGSTPQTTENPIPPAADPAMELFGDDPLAQMANALQNRKLDLDVREARLAERERNMQDLLGLIETKVARMEELNTALNVHAQAASVQSQQADSDRKKDIRKWVGIFEAMQPDNSWRFLLDLREYDLILEVLKTMETGKSALILNSMVMASQPSAEGDNEVQALAARLAEGLRAGGK